MAWRESSGKCPSGGCGVAMQVQPGEPHRKTWKDRIGAWDDSVGGGLDALRRHRLQQVGQRSPEQDTCRGGVVHRYTPPLVMRENTTASKEIKRAVADSVSHQGVVLMMSGGLCDAIASIAFVICGWDRCDIIVLPVPLPVVYTISVT